MREKVYRLLEDAIPSLARTKDNQLALCSIVTKARVTTLHDIVAVAGTHGNYCGTTRIAHQTNTTAMHKQVACNG